MESLAFRAFDIIQKTYRSSSVGELGTLTVGALSRTLRESSPALTLCHQNQSPGSVCLRPAEGLWFLATTRRRQLQLTRY